MRVSFAGHFGRKPTIPIGLDSGAQTRKSQIVVEATASEVRLPGSAVSLRFSVGSQHVRPLLDARVEARIQGALALGMQPLRTTATFDAYHLDPRVYPIYEPPGGIAELIRCMDLVNQLSSQISIRGLGRMVAVQLGTQFTKRENVEKPELWLQGLGRARGAEWKKVARVSREWADGDSVAAHYGFGVQLFCSEDSGKTGRGRSVLDRDSRKWLSEEYGIRFVNLAELAERVAES
jgi:hypothetical protein